MLCPRQLQVFQPCGCSARRSTPRPSTSSRGAAASCSGQDRQYRQAHQQVHSADPPSLFAQARELGRPASWCSGQRAQPRPPQRSAARPSAKPRRGCSRGWAGCSPGAAAAVGSPGLPPLPPRPPPPAPAQTLPVAPGQPARRGGGGSRLLQGAPPALPARCGHAAGAGGRRRGACPRRGRAPPPPPPPCLQGCAPPRPGRA